MIANIILHIGLPKAGSTTLQKWANANSQSLMDAGIYFPPPAKRGQHQALVTGLMKGDLRWLDMCLTQTEAPTLLLSAEGLSWHLIDFPKAHLQVFRDYLRPYNVTLFVNDRAQEPWARSVYHQCLINPRNPLFNYGTHQDFGSFINTPRMQFLLDRPKLLSHLKTAYGTENLLHSYLEATWAEDLCKALNAPELADSLKNHPPENKGLCSEMAELCRQINELELSQNIRDTLFAKIRDNSLNITTFSHDNASSTTLRTIVAQLTPHTPVQQKLVNDLIKQPNALPK